VARLSVTQLDIDGKAFGRHSAVLLEAPIDRSGFTVAEVLDHHEDRHVRRPGRVLTPTNNFPYKARREARIRCPRCKRFRHGQPFSTDHVLFPSM
jgi:hypothetical protein